MTAPSGVMLNDENPDHSLMAVNTSAVTWAYRLLLGREPESLDAIEWHCRQHVSVAAMCQFILCSEEFRSSSPVALPPANSITLGALENTTMPGLVEKRMLDRLGRAQCSGEPGIVYDFLGTRTRLSYLPTTHEFMSGAVEEPPVGGTSTFLHEREEWYGLFRALTDAEPRRQLVVAELGAGWGPWLVAAARAARILGIPEIRLVAAEADPGHLEFLRSHFHDNGLNPDEHRIIHCIVGTRDGFAWFPRLADPAANWGACAAFERTSSDDILSDSTIEVPCQSLATLFSGLSRIDLVHCDIQGAESSVLQDAISLLNEKVCRIVVGTHSRSIEEALMNAFGENGWQLESEKACQLWQSAAHKPPTLFRDGTQVWVNPRLTGAQ